MRVAMTTPRLPMHRIREIVRQKWNLGRTHREIARSVGCSVGSVWKVLDRATTAGLDLTAVEALDDRELEARVHGVRVEAPTTKHELPDFAAAHREHARPGVTLELLHLEYLAAHPDGYRYSQFCELYRRWLARRRLSMRQVHRAGEKCFVDYAGQRPYLVDRETGECTAVELFVMVLGASNLTYVEATLTQRGADFVASHMRGFEYFGGVPIATVCDQLRSGVSRPCRYEPEIQRTYEAMAVHYGTTVLPARPQHPRDKAKVEVAVQIAERWILARLRNEEFGTLEVLNERIADLLEELNGRTMRRYGASRRELFEQVERQHLQPLPAERFAYCVFARATVNIDYHVAYDDHAYSVPYQLRYEHDAVVDLRVTATTIEVLHKNRRVASHARSYAKHQHTTVPEHMPDAHRKHLEWTPSRIIAWAGKIGAGTQALVEKILESRRHPEQGYRTCLGLLRLTKSYGDERVEAACARALGVRAYSYRHVKSILEHGLDRQAVPTGGDDEGAAAPIDHENIRGAKYYH
jgi:transposase